MKKIKNFSLLLLLLSITTSCASKPRLYPNETFKKRGRAQANADIEKCMKEADEYLDSPEGRKIAHSAGIGLAIGGAMGAVAGAFSGDIIGGATQGAAIGGVGGAVSGSVTPDELEHRYVNQCLADKGYNVIGWD